MPKMNEHLAHALEFPLCVSLSDSKLSSLSNKLVDGKRIVKI